MQFIEDIKHKFGRWVFQKELKSNKRTKAVSNLEDAKSIGILYEATDAAQIKKIEPFVKYFFELKKDVKALGYVNKKKLDNHHIPKLNYEMVYKIKKENYFGKNGEDQVCSEYEDANIAIIRSPHQTDWMISVMRYLNECDQNFPDPVQQAFSRRSSNQIFSLKKTGPSSGRLN